MGLMGLALLTLGVALGFLIFYVHGVLQLTQLRDLPLPALKDRAWPKVSVIIAALNEESTIEKGLESVLALNYPNLEIIVLNDRSTDRTGEILSEMARKHPQLRTFHITELPSGWLGKNHALYYGAERATGD